MTTNDTYQIAPDGKLLRKGEHIGSVKDGEFIPLEGKANYAAAVTRWLNKQEDDDSDSAAPEPSLPVAADTRTREQKERDDMAHLEKKEREEVTKANAIYQDDLNFARRTGCPQPPKKNPALGDKTPEFVNWLHDYRHEEFLKRYQVTGKGKVPIVSVNPHTGSDEVTGEREVYFARRKTCLTEIDASREGLSAEMGDW